MGNRRKSKKRKRLNGKVRRIEFRPNRKIRNTLLRKGVRVEFNMDAGLLDLKPGLEIVARRVG